MGRERDRETGKRWVERETGKRWVQRERPRDRKEVGRERMTDRRRKGRREADRERTWWVKETEQKVRRKSRQRKSRGVDR